MDRYAAEADKILLMARIKPHTDFRGSVESGLMKMIAIGMGKQQGASLCHSRGFLKMSESIQEIAEIALKKLPFLCGIGIVENAVHRTFKIEVIPPDKIKIREPELLQEARGLVPKLPFHKADILVVDEIGKNICGPGMDPNVIGRSGIIGRWEPDFDAVMIRDITDESHHNGYGLGNADVTTQRAFEKFSFEETYPNSLTCGDPAGVKIPVVMPNDRLALKYALCICAATLPPHPRIVWIKNTLSVEQFYISEGMLEDAKKTPDLQVEPNLLTPAWDKTGNLIGWEECMF